MSNLCVNVRLWIFHLQVENGSIIPRISMNKYHLGAGSKLFEVYTWFPK